MVFLACEFQMTRWLGPLHLSSTCSGHTCQGFPAMLWPLVGILQFLVPTTPITIWCSSFLQQLYINPHNAYQHYGSFKAFYSSATQLAPLAQTDLLVGGGPPVGTTGTDQDLGLVWSPLLGVMVMELEPELLLNELLLFQALSQSWNYWWKCGSPTSTIFTPWHEPIYINWDYVKEIELSLLVHCLALWGSRTDQLHLPLQQSAVNWSLCIDINGHVVAAKAW